MKALLRLSLLFLAFAACLPARAPAAQTLLQEAAEPAPEVRTVHRSPRAVLAAFEKGMRRYYDLGTYDDEALSAALDCFETGELALPRDELEALAIQLHESLRRMTDVDPLRVGHPGPRDETFAWEIVGAPAFAVGAEPTTEEQQTRSAGTVEFLRIRAPGPGQPANWRFAPSLLEVIPTWHELWRDEPVRPENQRSVEEESRDLGMLERLAFELRESVPDALRQRPFLLEHWQWIGLLLLAFLGALVGRVVSFFLRLLTRRAARSERLEVDKQVMVGFERPFSLFVMAWIMLWMLPAVQLEPRVFRVLRLGVVVFLSLTGVWSTYRLVDVGASWLQSMARKTNNRFDDMLVPLVRRMAKIFLTFVGIVYVASYLTEDLYGIVAGLSIGSLAVGFAAKDSIENLFGTITVLLDKPFQLGDWITVGEVDGTVEEVGFRSTKIRTFYNSLITVPNSTFISAQIDNWGARRYRRIKTNVGLAYDTPPLKVEAFCEALRELVRKHPYTRKDYYHVYLNAFGPSSLDVLVYCFVETPDWSTELREKHRLYLDILRVAEGLGVEIAFPTQTLHLRTSEAGDAPPAPGPGPVDNARGAEQQGRQLADLIVKESLAEYEGQKPPPVVID